MAGQYNAAIMEAGVGRFLALAEPDGPFSATAAERLRRHDAFRAQATALMSAPVPPRQPTFCTGCPERPVFSAIKLVERELGKTHMSCDIGCHTFSALAPFNLGQTVMGYGLGLSSSTGIAPSFNKRVISIMGDGGFWHNGLATGVASAVFNQKVCRTGLDALPA